MKFLEDFFDSFFDRFLIDFDCIFDPKTDKKSIKNRSTNHPNSTTKIQKSAKSAIHMPPLALRQCYVVYKIQ